MTAAEDGSGAAALPAHELVGPPDAPLLVVLGGISATRHVTTGGRDAAPGWWDAVVGEGRAVDTRRWRVLSFDWLDGGEAADGGPARTVTTGDQADAVAALLDHHGVSRAHAVIGASYGGMVALAFAERHAARLRRLVVIGAAHGPHAMSTGVRALQRRIVRFGLAAGRAREGVALARALAMTTYRSPREFAARFPAAPEPAGAADATFPVERYLLHHGERFADRMSPARFLALSLSVDLHRVDPGRITTPAVLVAAEGDTLVPGEQMEELAACLAGPRRLLRLPTIHGHDAFLTEPRRMGRLLRAALTTPTLR